MSSFVDIACQWRLRKHWNLLLFLLASITHSSLQQPQQQQQQQQQPQQQEQLLEQTQSSSSIPNRWFWDRNHYYDPNQIITTPVGRTSRALVVVQASGVGPELEVLEVTSKVNRAYAKRWTSDYLKFTGIALGQHPWQATFNKAYVLQHFVQAKLKKEGFEVYDAVLILDSNTVIVDLDYDVLALLPENKLLSSGVKLDLSERDEYSDVMIWNLNHPQIELISSLWLQQCIEQLGDKKTDSESVLLEILRNEYDQTDTSNNNNNRSHEDEDTDIVESIPETMVNGLRGTLIKQDTANKNKVIEQSDLSKIIPTIQGIADSVCYRYYPQCEVV